MAIILPMPPEEEIGHACATACLIGKALRMQFRGGGYPMERVTQFIQPVGTPEIPTVPIAIQPNDESLIAGVDAAVDLFCG